MIMADWQPRIIIIFILYSATSNTVDTALQKTYRKYIKNNMLYIVKKNNTCYIIDKIIYILS